MRITALSEVLPGEPVTNRYLAERFGLHEQWLDRMTGNRSRYLCRPDSPDGVPKSTGDLAYEAGARALAAAEQAGIPASGIEFAVLTTASPDHLMPATVNLVGDRLGLDDIPMIQLASGCAGAIQGMYTARALLRSGLRRGLVIGADTCRNLWPGETPGQQVRPAELINLALFGDGGGAAVVDAQDDGPGLVVEHVFVRTTGKGRAPGQVVRWYGAEGAPYLDVPGRGRVREGIAEESYKEIERNVPGIAQAILDELLAVTGWRLDEVDHVLTPQLNGVMTEKIREHLGVRPEQAVSCVADTGNNGNALPFIQLNRTADRLNRDGRPERILVVTVESSKWIVSGMALTAPRGAFR